MCENVQLLSSKLMIIQVLKFQNFKAEFHTHIALNSCICFGAANALSMFRDFYV